MAKDLKTVFLLSENGYAEISYELFSKTYKPDKAYMEAHFFIRLQEFLMEVLLEDYKDHYREHRRQKYLKELAIGNDDVSFDALTTVEFNGEDILIDRAEDVADQVTNHIMLDKLNEYLPLLSGDEQALVRAIYFEPFISSN